MEVEGNLLSLESENEQLRVEVQDASQERAKIKQVVDDLMKADRSQDIEAMKNEFEKYKARASYFEREYNKSKQLNSEMTKVMSQMTQAVAERSDERTETSQQNRLLQKQFEARATELRDAKAERD